jgi:hypothetical protein
MPAKGSTGSELCGSRTLGAPASGYVSRVKVSGTETVCLKDMCERERGIGMREKERDMRERGA